MSKLDERQSKQIGGIKSQLKFHHEMLFKHDAQLSLCNLALWVIAALLLLNAWLIS